MKYRLVELLQCPKTRGSLTLEIFQSTKNNQKVDAINSVECKKWCTRLECSATEVATDDCIKCYQIDINEGKLVSEGGDEYPIIEGIPRLLPPQLLAESLATYHTKFIEKYKLNFSKSEISVVSTRKKIQTLHAFGYQWTTFKENFNYFKSIFLSFVEPFLGPQDFEGKLVLEVGCGSGRPASVASSFGAEVVAVDLSEAVKTAHSMTKHFPKLHVVQADAYALPFSPCFDFVYSVGVLQHIPDPNKALKSISNVIPDNHKLVLWVYGIREFWYQPIEWLRVVTTKMPYKLLPSTVIFYLLYFLKYFYYGPIAFLESFNYLNR